jgi:tetratricopeptide (TPR) repeat protein
MDNVSFQKHHCSESKKKSIPQFFAMSREACQINPLHFRALKLLGGVLYAMGDYRAAKDALKDALKINPRYPDALCDLGTSPSAYPLPLLARLLEPNTGDVQAWINGKVALTCHGP